MTKRIFVDIGYCNPDALSDGQTCASLEEYIGMYDDLQVQITIKQ